MIYDWIQLHDDGTWKIISQDDVPSASSPVRVRLFINGAYTAIDYDGITDPQTFAEQQYALA